MVLNKAPINFKTTKPINKPYKSSKQGKKGMVFVLDNGKKKLIHFGLSSMSDFTKHKDPARRKNYLSRSGGIKNKQGQALLGQRLNRPAKNYWFVPGGRILKDESLSDAFNRLTLEELGTQLNIQAAELLGPYDHFYQDNVFNSDFSTHYVAIAYVVILDDELQALPLNLQHAGYQWFNVDELLTHDLVHSNTKNYFR